MASLTEKIRTLLINYRQAPAMIWRRCNAHISYRFSNLKNHQASPPEAINFYPTDRCNLKCSMCFERLRKPRQEMQISDWHMIIDQIKKFRPRIHLSGGEPFLYPRIMDLITLIKKENLFLVITTNGTMLSKYANEIVASNVNRLHISLDGPEKIHDRIRGVPGTFKNLMMGLKRIKKLRGMGHLPVIRINSMLNLSDPAAMQEVINIACSIDADRVQFQHPLFVDKQGLASHRFFLKKNLKLDLNYWENANIDIERPEDLTVAGEIIRHLQAERSINVNVFPDMPDTNLEAYYTKANDLHQTYQGTCRAMWNTATILPSGDLESCPDYIVGNCKESPFISLWNNTIMQQLRKRIRQNNLFTVCKGCCFFYG